jgi:protein-S-isoprenylcysteine O-methyltransferase Ste14
MTADLAALIVLASWALLAPVFCFKFFRQQKEATPETTKVPQSSAGMILEGFAIGLAWGGPPATDENVTLLWIAAILAPISSILLVVALRQLGRQWSLQARVRENHVLITSGIYSVIRHPIYTALLGLMLATAFVRTGWETTLAAVLLYLAGTEIRIRAEEKLLCERFGQAFRDYQARVSAYLPYLR